MSRCTSIIVKGDSFELGEELTKLSYLPEPHHVKSNGVLQNMKRLAWPFRLGGYTALEAKALGWEKELYSTLRGEFKHMNITEDMIYKSDLWTNKTKDTGEIYVKDPWPLDSVGFWCLQRRKLYYRILGGGYSHMNAYGYRQMRFKLERIQSNDKLLRTFMFMKQCLSDYVNAYWLKYKSSQVCLSTLNQFDGFIDEVLSYLVDDAIVTLFQNFVCSSKRTCDVIGVMSKLEVTCTELGYYPCSYLELIS